MKKFNASDVANFLASKKFVAFEHQAPAMVAAHFGVTAITASRWVNRVIAGGLLVRSARVALTLARP